MPIKKHFGFVGEASSREDIMEQAYRCLRTNVLYTGETEDYEARRLSVNISGWDTLFMEVFELVSQCDGVLEIRGAFGPDDTRISCAVNVETRQADIYIGRE